MTARIICMASSKGGSGKTTLTAAFATFLSKLGKKVLMVDGDPATNGLTLLYIKEVMLNAEIIRSKRRSPVGLFTALSAEISEKAVDILTVGESLDFLPATYNLQDADINFEILRYERMKFLMQQCRIAYDYVFVDSQAGADNTAQLMMSRGIADDVVIVSEYDPMSAAGVERLKAIMRDHLTYERTWVLLNKILPEFAKSFSDFLEVAKYLSPIPWDADVVRAYARRKLAVETESGNAYTLAVLHALRGLVGEEAREDIEKWVQNRAAILRQPIEEQYADAEKEMATLLRQSEEFSRARRWALITAYISVSTGAGAAAVVWLEIFNRETLTNKISDFLGSWEMLSSIIFPLMGVLVALSLLAVSRRGFGLESVDKQIKRQRTERQLDLVQQRLKKLELLRTLDSETLLQQKPNLN